MSLKAYQQAQVSSESPRETELRLFTVVTRSLVGVRESGERDKEFFKALDWNRRMWSALSTDCGVEGNQLSDELRAGIISLSIWVSKHTSQVARGKDDDIDALINVNRTIMEGLAMIPGQAEGSEEVEESTASDLQKSGVEEEV